jgi:DNA repair protein RecO (recombination protein O)
MIEKTDAIVLHQIKYTDSGIIVQLYTKKFGRSSVLVRGMRKKKTGRQHVFFQPLSMLEMVIYYRDSERMKTLREFSVSYAPNNIYNNVIKSCIALFIGEVLTTVLREETPNDELFDFIKDSIIYFDKRDTGFANFHIAFLIGLCSFLGFEPGKKGVKENQVFDMINGTFVSVPPSHGSYANTEISGIMAEFFSSSWDDMNKITLTGSKRNDVLSAILIYYSVHLPSLKKINSLEILKEVFA